MLAGANGMTEKARFQKAFRGIHFRFSRLYARFLTEVGLTLQQYALLHLLQEEGSVSMRTASDRLHITKPAVTYLADHLESEGLIKRQRHPTDRRVHLLAIQQKGKHIVNRAQHMALDFLMSTLLRFKPHEREVVGSFYTLLAVKMDKVLSSQKVSPK
jgi:DNA-binding MarR family transcriptional regulator